MTEPQSAGIRQIVVAVDGSEHAERAGLVAVDLAHRINAKLALLSVDSHPERLYGVARHELAVRLEDTDEEMLNARKEASESMKRIYDVAAKQGVDIKSRIIKTGPDIVSAIVDYAYNENADLIVVGSRGLSAYQSSLLGSVSSGIVANARCSVMVVR
jgi:nucleotide-binding universal stress UspA family protein